MGKAPWVDECYTYYGISHETFGSFFDSICSGINFSPPLYFLLNWIFQLIFSLPIETLRIESALWISVGAIHPGERSEKFHNMLPHVINRINQGEYPNEQAGHFDLILDSWEIFINEKN